MFGAIKGINMNDFLEKRNDVRISELKTELLQLSNEVDKNKIMVENYHKQKNNCLKICEEYVQKTNSLLIDDAVQKEQIKVFSDIVPDLWKAIDSFRSIEKRVYLITGGIAVLVFIGEAIMIPLLLKKLS